MSIGGSEEGALPAAIKQNGQVIMENRNGFVFENVKFSGHSCRENQRQWEFCSSESNRTGPPDSADVSWLTNS